jgi:hypothetical protein
MNNTKLTNDVQKGIRVTFGHNNEDQSLACSWVFVSLIHSENLDLRAIQIFTFVMLNLYKQRLIDLNYFANAAQNYFFSIERLTCNLAKLLV